jgi:hypothetical protein
MVTVCQWVCFEQPEGPIVRWSAGTNDGWWGVGLWIYDLKCRDPPPGPVTVLMTVPPSLFNFGVSKPAKGWPLSSGWVSACGAQNVTIIIFRVETWKKVCWLVWNMSCSHLRVVTLARCDCNLAYKIITDFISWPTLYHCVVFEMWSNLACKKKKCAPRRRVWRNFKKSIQFWRRGGMPPRDTDSTHTVQVTLSHTQHHSRRYYDRWLLTLNSPNNMKK